VAQQKNENARPALIKKLDFKLQIGSRWYFPNDRKSKSFQRGMHSKEDLLWFYVCQWKLLFIQSRCLATKQKSRFKYEKN